MVRYFIRPDMAVLSWLLMHDKSPHVLPVFPEDDDTGLVVAHLLSGDVVAEVIPAPSNVTVACGAGLPLGRLYFQIPKNLLYPICENLEPTHFGG